jgi:ABC-type transport system involved in multi-copper enzyme maturation permease subunit
MEDMEGYMMLLLGCLMAPMGSPLAGDSFAGERERNSLELLQLSPIAPARLFWGKLLAIVPFPVGFALLAQFVYWASHPDISTVAAIASILGALSAVFLTTSFSLMLSLRVKTVRAAAHISLFVVVPLLLLVQLFHETFLAGLFIPVVTLFVSLAFSVLTAILSMRKFANM